MEKAANNKASLTAGRGIRAAVSLQIQKSTNATTSRVGD